MPHDFNKPNLLLDLDQTLISAEPTEEIDMEKYKDKHSLFRSDNMEDYYIIYSRPHLQNFLDYAFKNFNVSVWTAASKDYALFIIEKILLNNQPERKLDFIFFSYHCDVSKKEKEYSKELCMLWDVYKLPGYSKDNTVIIDDYKADVHKCQPNLCVIAPPFEFREDNSDKDTFLVDLIPELDKMLERINSKEKIISTGEIDIATSVNENLKSN